MANFTYRSVKAIQNKIYQIKPEVEEENYQIYQTYLVENKVNRTLSLDKLTKIKKSIIDFNSNENPTQEDCKAHELDTTIK